MKRFVCPICEHELTAKSVCPVCRKIIREPWVFEGRMPNEYTGNYILNHSGETHSGVCIEPNRSRRCETPQEKRQDQQFTAMKNDGTVYKRYEGPISVPGSQIGRDGSSAERNYSAGTRSKAASKSGSTAKKVGCGCGIGCLGVLIAIIVMIGIGVSALESSWDDIFGWIESEGWLETVDYDAIMEAGEACSGNGHYLIEGEKVYEELTVYAQKILKIKAMDIVEYVNNVAYPMGDDEVWTFYDQCYEWYWENGTIELSEDTVTGQLHYLSIYGEEKEEVIALAAYGLTRIEGCDEDEVRQWLESVGLDGDMYTFGNSNAYFGKYEGEEYYYFDAYPINE